MFQSTNLNTDLLEILQALPYGHFFSLFIIEILQIISLGDVVSSYLKCIIDYLCLFPHEHRPQIHYSLLIILNYFLHLCLLLNFDLTPNEVIRAFVMQISMLLGNTCCQRARQAILD